MLDILFICHGNICRSPLAEFVMKDLTERQGACRKISDRLRRHQPRGVWQRYSSRTRRVLEREGIPFSPVRHAKSRKRL